MVIFQRILFGALLLLGGNYITLTGMDNHGGQVTVTCDWCNQPQTKVMHEGPCRAHGRITCFHIFCNGCHAILSPQYPNVTDQFFWCRFCNPMYTQKNRVCWKKVPGVQGPPAQGELTADYLRTWHAYQERNFKDAHAGLSLPTRSPDGYSAQFKADEYIFNKLYERREAFFGVCAGVGILIGCWLAYKKYYAEDKEVDEEEKQETEEPNGKQNEIA